MNKIIFNLQLFASVTHGKSSNERITNNADNSQVYGLGGNDTIDSSKNNVTLIGGSGNDLLIAGAGTTTLNGGAGNDTFGFTYSSSERVSALIEDIDPSKDQIIVNYNGSSTPNLNYKTIGDDLLLSDDKGYLNVTIKGTIPLDSYYDEEGDEKLWDVLRIVNKNRESNGLSPLTLSQGLMNGASTRSSEIIDYFSHTRPNGTSCDTVLDSSIYSYIGENIAAGQSSADDVMTSWMNSTGHRANILTSGFTKLGVGYKYSSGTIYGSYWVQMFSGIISTKTLNKSDMLNTKTTLMLNYDTKSSSTLKDIMPLALNDKNGTSGNDTIKNSDDNVAIDALSGNDIIINGQWYAEKGGTNLKINGGAGNDTITSSGSKSLLDGGVGDDLIYNGYYYYEPWGAGGFLNDSYNQEYNDANGSSNVTIEGGAGNDTINNRGSRVTISGGAGNDTITKDSSANYNVFRYTNGDGNDKIYGYNSTDSLYIINGQYTTDTVENNVIVSVGTGKITLDGAAGKTINIKGKMNDDTIIGDDTSTLLSVNDSTTSPVTAASSIKTINASKRTTAVKITGNSLDNSIKGGSGNDTLDGSKGADTLYGGKGNDVFLYSSGSGNDVITDYVAGQDKIKITGGKISKTSVSGSDVILTVGSGSIKIKNGKSKELSLYNNSNSLTTTIIGGSSTIVTVNNSTKSPVTVGTGITTIDASKRTTSVKITGNAKANLIKGGSAKDTIYGGSGNDSILGNSSADVLLGDSGNDTLYGGRGNDTLTGGAGSDVFVYVSGDGNDVITDYTAKQDKIKLSNATISGSSLKGSDVVLKVGTGSITVKNGKNKSISVVDDKGKTSSQIYGNSSRNYVEKLWFEVDDNFADDEVSALAQQNVGSNNDYNNVNGQITTYDFNSILIKDSCPIVSTNVKR